MSSGIQTQIHLLEAKFGRCQHKPAVGHDKPRKQNHKMLKTTQVRLYYIIVHLQEA